MLGIQAMEDHHFVDPVDEFRPEVLAHLAHHGFLDHVRIVQRLVGRQALDLGRADVAGHHHHGVAEVHGTALAIGQPAVVQHLQQDVEHVRMRLLDLVEQDDAVRVAPHGLGQVAALFIAHVSRRRTDQSRHGVFLHEFAHVDADQVIFGVEHEAGQRLAQFRLAHAGGPQEEEGTPRPVGIGQAGARTADGVGHQGDGLVLADHALVQFLFHLEQFLALAFHHLGDGNAGSPRDHFGDFLGTHDGAQQLRLAGDGGLVGLQVGLCSVDLGQAFLQLGQLAVLQLGQFLVLALALQLGHLRPQLVDLALDLGAALHGGLLGFQDLFVVRVFLADAGDFLLDQFQAFLRRVIGFLAHSLTLDLELDQPAVQAVHHLGLGVDLHLDARGSLVDKVDGLVGQEAVGDVAVGQLGRSHDGRVGDLHAVVDLIAFLQAAQDGDGGFHRRLAHQHFLEAALQGGVLLDVLAVFVQGGGAHAVQLAARQCRLEHVAGVHGTVALAGAHHGVDLVDEDDGAAFIRSDVLEHGLQAFLELAPILGTGQQCGHVQRQHALVLQRIGHFAIDDALGQPLDDGGLAHTGLADQHGVVLGATLQDLDGAPDLVVTADDRVELARAGPLGQVQRVFLQRLALALGILRFDGLAAAHGVDSRLQRLVGEPSLDQQPAGLAALTAIALGQRQQEHLDGHVLVAALFGVLLGLVEQFEQLAADLRLAGLTADLRQVLQCGLDRAAQGRDADAGALQQRTAGTVRLGDDGSQHVDRLDVGVVCRDGQALGVGQGFLELGGEFVYTHVGISFSKAGRNSQPAWADLEFRQGRHPAFR